MKEEIKNPNKLFKRTTVEEKEGIKDRTRQLQKISANSEGQKTLGKRGRRGRTTQHRFTKNPFSFTRKLMDEANSRMLTRSRGVLRGNA